VLYAVLAHTPTLAKSAKLAKPEGITPILQLTAAFTNRVFSVWPENSTTMLVRYLPSTTMKMTA
jgi:hypothetical protein